MRIFLSIVAVHLLLIGVIAAGIGWWGWQQYQAPGPLAESKLIDIPRGYGVSLIADRLKQQGIITKPLLFRLAARLMDKQTALKAGEYEVPAGISLKQLLVMLETGAVYQRKFTIPEGLTSWQIVNLLNDVEGMEGAVDEIPVEGTLLPETYQFVRGEDRSKKIVQMQKAMEQTLNELWESRAADLPIETKEEALVLASIVEKETGVSEERRRVAGVFINRLRKGIALQTDPTVIYALTKGEIQSDGKGPLGRRLLKKDLEIDSPYNTYKYPGLPPGPIANPGRDAIAAVLNPEAHDFIYFVADGSGGHVFAKTLAEHNSNVAKWRKIRRSQK